MYLIICSLLNFAGVKDSRDPCMFQRPMLSLTIKHIHYWLRCWRRQRDWWSFVYCQDKLWVSTIEGSFMEENILRPVMEHATCRYNYHSTTFKYCVFLHDISLQGSYVNYDEFNSRFQTLNNVYGQEAKL